MGKNRARLIDADKVGIDGRKRLLGEQFTKALPGQGSADPETLGSRLSIKQIANHHAQTMDDLLYELRLVDDALERDNEDIVPTERVYLNRRRKVILRRMNGEDPRYRVVGARVGGLFKEEQASVDQYKAMQEFERLLVLEEEKQFWWRPGDKVQGLGV